MTGIELPSFGALVSAIKFVFQSIKSGIEFSAQKRREWFDDHIEPSYQQLKAIHEDYTKHFSKALVALRSGVGLGEIVALLKSQRPKQLLERQEVKENMIALRDFRLEKKRKPKFLVSFYDYVASVDDYLVAASPLPYGETWYTYFINTLSKLVESRNDPLKYDYQACAQGKDAPRIAAEELERAVQTNMPEAFRKVQANYGKLRAECLSG